MGGSIAAGVGAPPGYGYADVLAGIGATVHTHAVRSSGSGMPSYCVNDLLPPALQLDALVLEFAVKTTLSTPITGTAHSMEVRCTHPQPWSGCFAPC